MTMTPRSTLPLTPLASIPLTPGEFAQVLTPAEFEEKVWLRFLAAGAGHAGRPLTEAEIETLLGREITSRLRLTVRMVKVALAAAAATNKGEVS